MVEGQIRAQFYTDNKGNLVDSWYREADNNPTKGPHSKVCTESCYEAAKEQSCQA